MKRHHSLVFISKRISAVTLLLVFALGICSPSQAALLGVGGQLVPPSEAVPAGLVELATNTAPFAGIGFSGTVTSKVFRNDSSNPFGANSLTFTYQIVNSASSVHVLHRFTTSDYTGFSTDVSFDPATTGVPPSQADRTTANVVGFNFIETAGQGQGLITPGTQSRTMVVQTNATSFAQSIASLINGGVSTVPSFAPVPEPGTWILAAIGLLGLAGLVRRSRRAAAA